MLLEIVIGTAAIELLTILARNYFGSVKKAYRKNQWKLRVHHGYIGLATLIVSFILVSSFMAIIGASLLLADIIHHFMVLPLMVGDTEFP